MVADLEHFVRRVVAFDSTTKRQTALSSCLPAVNDTRNLMRCRAACCRNVTISLGSNRRIGYLSIYKPIDIAATRSTTTHRLVCFASDMVTSRQYDKVPFGPFR
jgi:hypothetical protein